MPALHNRERDVADYREARHDDREISLGTGTILGIFFTLALLCAVFFGFGYSMGRKSGQPVSVVPAGSTASAYSGALSSGASNSGASKPAAGDPGTRPTAPSPSDSEAAGTAAADIVVPSDPDAAIVSAASPPKQSTPSALAPKPSGFTIRNAVPPASNGDSTLATVRPSARSAAAASPQGESAQQVASIATGSLVQVAAVSHQEDADVLLAALKGRGYAVFIRQEPQDRLLHVQLGPFATKKDAEAMRQRLLSDGYNAIVK